MAPYYRIDGRFGVDTWASWRDEVGRVLASPTVSAAPSDRVFGESKWLGTLKSTTIPFDIGDWLATGIPDLKRAASHVTS